MFWVRSDLDSAKKISFQFWGGVVWVRSDLDSAKKIRVFNLGGGVLGKVGIGLWEEFQFGGVFWVRSDLDSGKNFNWGGCSGTKFQNRGVLENLVKNLWKPSLLVHHR